jgi:flagellar biosynthesis protein FlhA
VDPDGGRQRLRLAPSQVQRICELLGRETNRLIRSGRAPIVLVSPELRADLKQLTRARNPDLVVLSYDEITADTCVEIVRRASDLVPVAA